MRDKREPSWTDLHMVAKYALLDSAESQGWDWKTVQGYIHRLPKDAPALNAHNAHIAQRATPPKRSK